MSSKRLGPGSAFRMIGDVQGRVTEATYRVTAFDPPTTFSLESASGPMHIRAGLLIQPVDGGSQVHQTVEFHLHGLMRLARPYVAVTISRDLRVRFAALKQCLERQDDLVGVK